MFLSYTSLYRPAVATASAIVGLALAVSPALGQQPADLRITPNVHAWEATQIRQAQIRQRRADAARIQSPTRAYATRRTATVPEIVVTMPQMRGTPIETVTIRSADGGVKSFPIAGGREAIVVRRFSIRPGQSITFAGSP